MPQRQDIKLYIGLAGSITLFLLILSDAWMKAYTLDEKMIYLLLAIISTMIGVDIFRSGNMQQSAMTEERKKRREGNARNTNHRTTTDGGTTGDPGSQSQTSRQNSSK